jgi:ATP-binding cassette subfamily B protein
MIIKNIPTFRQSNDYDCGATALQVIFAYFGIEKNVQEIIKLVKTTENGTSMIKMRSIVEKHGFKTKLGEMTVEDIKKYLNKKIPVILLVQAWPYKKIIDWQNSWSAGHYVVAIGYDKNKLYFEDPSSIYRTYLSYKELKDRWHDIRDGKKCVNYGLAIYGKKPIYNQNKIIPMG